MGVSTTLLITAIISAVVLLGPAARAQTGPDNPQNDICTTVTYPTSHAAGGGTDFLYYCEPPSHSTIGGDQVNFPAVSSISDATGTIATYTYESPV